MKIYIFRHGETYFSKRNIDYGDYVESTRVLEEGKPAIRRLAKYLKDIPTEANFTSPFIRCVETCQIVSETTGKHFEVDDNLRDYDPRVETTEDVVKRILIFAKWLESTKYKSVAICTHGYPINALIAFFTKGSIQEEDLHRYPTPGVLVTIENKKVSYKDFNK